MSENVIKITDWYKKLADMQIKRDTLYVWALGNQIWRLSHAVLVNDA